MKWIMAPLVGALIGLLTNGLAIKMLFRPFKPVFIGKFRVPFTPGLIPKERKRIAQAVGQVIGRSLLDSDTLKNALCSQNMETAFREKAGNYIQKLEESPDNVEQYLDRKHFLAVAEGVKEKALATFPDYAAHKLSSDDMGHRIIDMVMTDVVENLGPMVKMVAKPALEASRESLGNTINTWIDEKMPGLVSEYLEKSYRGLMESPVKDAGASLRKHEKELEDYLWKMYQELMEKKAAELVAVLDIPTIIEEKIAVFDMEELEHLILEISQKELNSLVWLGGILGMLIGFINAFF
ncbi:MAG: DUF445 family protein [Eubacteriales bacterium]|nr:DUF445 family protein [Eubacteriales bacterium]